MTSHHYGLDPVTLFLRRYLRTLAGVAFLFGALNVFVIGTPFIDVNMGAVVAGRSTPVKGPGGEGLLVFNKEDKPVHVRLSVVAPPNNIQAIPDTAWIRITPTDMVVPPHQNVIFHIMVTIPAEDRFHGKTYMAFILTSIIPASHDGLDVLGALQSRLHFSVK